MKQERVFPRFVVTKKQEKNIKKGHPWIYADEIVESSDIEENGCVVDVFGGKHQNDAASQTQHHQYHDS